MKRVDIHDFPRVLGQDMRRLNEKLKDAAYLAALKNVNVVAEKSPVDTGFYKASHVAQKTSNGAKVTNTAPYAGVLEAGARRHGVSAEGIERLAQWALRKGIAQNKEQALQIAIGKARKLAMYGEKPRWIYKNSLKEMKKNMEDMMRKVVHTWQP